MTVLRGAFRPKSSAEFVGQGESGPIVASTIRRCINPTLPLTAPGDGLTTCFIGDFYSSSNQAAR